MTDRDKTTEMFLVAQGYDRDKIAEALSALAGTDSRDGDTDSRAPLLTARELCGMLRISVTTLWRLRPPHMVVGARKRYQLAEVKEFLAKRQAGKNKPALDTRAES